ncbi:MAG: hypothetical protein HY216_13390 [Candidatus Rokubacteria bacterium]|nr:hypothetical protein [Candidatus Rokubacteria bacterium]
MRRLIAVLLVTATATPALACVPVDLRSTAWPAATERDARGKALRRFIPPELYAGAPWDGARELALRPMAATRTPREPVDHPPITIMAPVPWPGDPAIPALRRVRTGRRTGTIEQWFVINERGDGLGRLTDSRKGAVRLDECFKFPIGVWTQGETRRCRDSVIVIRDLDFVYPNLDGRWPSTVSCVPHSLRFRWNDEGTYVFSPERGMVAVIEHSR